MSEVIAFHFLGARRDRIVRSHGNAKQDNRPYARIAGAVRKEATERATHQKNADRLVSEVRQTMGPEAATLQRTAAKAIIQRVRAFLGEDSSRRVFRHNMAVQMLEVQSKYFIEFDVPENNYYLDIHYSNYKTQVL